MQVMAVTAGGRLAQHVPDIVGHERHCPAVDKYGAVEVHIDAGSRLGRIFGARARRDLPSPPVRRRAIPAIARWRPPTTDCSRPSSCRASASRSACSGTRRPGTTARCSRRSPRPPARTPRVRDASTPSRRMQPARATASVANRRTRCARLTAVRMQFATGPDPTDLLTLPVVDAARGLAEGEAGLAAPRHLPARRPVRADRRNRLRRSRRSARASPSTSTSCCASSRRRGVPGRAGRSGWSPTG